MREMNLKDDTVTMDTINLAAARLNLYGMRVVVSPHIQPVPKISINPTFKPCSDKFRAEYNRWLLDMFGTKEVCYMMDGNVIVSPKQAAALGLKSNT